MSTSLRYLLFLFGLFISLPLCILLIHVPSTPVTPTGVVYLFSYVSIVIGLIAAPWMPKRFWIFILAGGLLATATISIRISTPPAGSHINIVTLPNRTEARILNRIVNEQDAVLFGARIGPYMGLISELERENLVPTFSQAYKDMYSYGATPLSPFLTTYLNQQGPARFDAVIAEPRSDTTTKTAIIFLHGFGGNFTVQCWLIAKPGFSIDALTVCPSTGPSGAWWNPQGEAILQETIQYLHQRGILRIYLAGLSNGAIGSSRLAEKYKDQIAGLILISGADPQATITDLPVLVLHGKNDERIPVAIMEQYASAARKNAIYHLFEGDHFLLLKQADQVQEVIIDWLAEQER